MIKITWSILFVMAAVASGDASLAQTAAFREPAAYPHDMTYFGCSNRDEDEVCDQVPAPPPDYNPLVGTWMRYSLLRNGFSMQPPDAPNFITFMEDGYWSMMEFFPNRPKGDGPLETQRLEDLNRRFHKLGGGFGVYTNAGQVNYRHHLASMNPGYTGGYIQERAWRFVGNVLVLEGTGPTRSPQIHTRKLPNQKLDSRALVGSWERINYRLEGAEVTGQALTQRLLLGGDGWFMATTLPSGRPDFKDVPRERWTVQQFAAAYAGLEASRGTYTADETRLAIRLIGDVDPSLEGRVVSGTYEIREGGFDWRGVDAKGRRFVSTYRRLPRFDVYAPIVKSP
jgi:hypothetical protein